MVRLRDKSWDEYHREMIRETEQFIEFGLNHPDLIIEIPSKPVGQGGWPKQVADWFWGTVLTTKPNRVVATFREILRRRPKLRGRRSA